jgi:hypothetical protein
MGALDQLPSPGHRAPFQAHAHRGVGLHESRLAVWAKAACDPEVEELLDQRNGQPSPIAARTLRRNARKIRLASSRR